MADLSNFSLEGKNAWITGASYGIGFNIARAFVQAGVKNIVFNDINEEALQRGLANYKEAGITNVKGYVCDVTDEVAVGKLVDTIHKEVGQIDILVNNAGIIKRIPVISSGKAAVDFLLKYTPDLILLDYMMPMFNGAAVFKIIKSREATKDIPVYFLTGQTDKSTVMECLSLKPAGYIVKPVAKDALLEKLARAFGK